VTPRTCFLVVGPESAGNRLLAALLVSAGCHGDGSTAQRWDPGLPTGISPAVVIRSFPHGGQWIDLRHVYDGLRIAGYKRVVTLVTVRHPVAMARSQVRRGHAHHIKDAEVRIERAYLRIVPRIQSPFLLVPYEALVAGEASRRELLLSMGLTPGPGPWMVEGELVDVVDRNPAALETEA
jgi:hypothetical protein